MDSIEDIFESSLNLEQSHFTEGYNEGYSDGLVSGKQDGREVGLKTGFQSAIRAESNCFSARVQKTIMKMDDLVSNYPASDPENESVSDIMDSLRLNFRIVCATLGMKLGYEGYPKASDVEKLEF